MLKRQRQVSPPPSIPSIPLIRDPPTVWQHDLKRRRLLPPVLDGQARGWGKPDDTCDEDDEEDAYFSEDDVGETPPYDCGQYKSANSVLYELHALHQHRLLFSPPAPSQLRIATSHRATCTHLSTTAFDEHSSIKSNLPPSSERHKHYSGDTDRKASESTVPSQEVLRVKERYENRNKFRGQILHPRRRRFNSTPYSLRLLGSVFLSRRCELRSPDEQPRS